MSWLMTGKVWGCLGGETGGREEKNTDRYVLCIERRENNGQGKKKKKKDEGKVREGKVLS